AVRRDLRHLAAAGVGVLVADGDLGGQPDVVEHPAVEGQAVARVVVGRVGDGAGAPVAAAARGRAGVTGAEGVAEDQVGDVVDVDHRAEVGARDGDRLGVVDRSRAGELRDLGDAADPG